MPALIINTSPNIASLDSRIVASLCDGKFHLSISPSVFIGSGALNVLGASFKVVSPAGVIIKNYPTSGYDIFSDSPSMQSVIEVNLPTQGGTYQFGTYIVDARLTDADGTQYTLSKSVKICEPDKAHKTRNYGSLSAAMDGICKDDKLFITVDTPPNYRGVEVESQENDFKLLYPTVSELDPIEDITLTSFSVQLYEGVYNLTGTICATYNLGDYIFIEVLYKVKRDKDIKCIIDECCIFGKLAELHTKLSEKCTAAEINELSAITVDTLRLYKTAILAAQCGEDPSVYITDLEALLGCQCTCNCNEGTPIINNAPAKDFIITGCNVQKSTVGLTDSYVIENYAYTVTLEPNGGILTIGAQYLDGCTVVTPLTFDLSKLYLYIATSASVDYLSWAAIINKSINGVNGDCIGVSQIDWSQMTFAQRVQAIITAQCSGGSCGARIDTDEVSSVGANAIFTWENAVQINSYDLVDIFIDDVLQGTVKASLGTYTAVGKADGNAHSYSLVSRCSNGVLGNALDGTFTFFGCPTIAPPTVTLASVSDADCPYDLTALVNALPSGIEAEWHNLNNTNASSLVADPENAVDGTYYVFAKNGDGCYSLGVKVILVCSEATNCSAPQNLIVEAISGGFRVRFISAAYPPPSNSYTVKRKLASAPDVDGSYTTIGTPTYNSTVERWEILDATGSNNILYTYKAISNCSDTTPSVLYTFANLTCPVLTLTPNSTTVDYSFTNVGGGVDKYEVSIYDSTGLTLIHTNTHTPAFSSPITGTLIYLEGGTAYKVRVKVYIGTYSYTCAFTSISTDAVYTISYSNNSSAADPLQLLIGNLNTSPSNTIYNGNYSSDPVTGTSVNLPAVNANVLFAVSNGKLITSISCNGVPGTTGGGSSSWSNVNGSVIITFTTD